MVNFKNEIKSFPIIESISFHIKKMKRLKFKYDMLSLFLLTVTMLPLTYGILEIIKNHQTLMLMSLLTCCTVYVISALYCDENSIKMPKLKNKFLFFKDKEIQHKCLYEMEKKNPVYFEKTQQLLTQFNTSQTYKEQWKYINQLEDIIIEYNNNTEENKKMVDTQELMSEYQLFLKENNLQVKEKALEVNELKKYL